MSFAAEWDTSEVRRVSREINEQLRRTLDNSYIGHGNGSTFTLGSHGDVAIPTVDDGRVLIVDEAEPYFDDGRRTLVIDENGRESYVKRACPEPELPPEPTLREVWAD